MIQTMKQMNINNLNENIFADTWGEEEGMVDAVDDLFQFNVELIYVPCGTIDFFDQKSSRNDLNLQTGDNCGEL